MCNTGGCTAGGVGVDVCKCGWLRCWVGRAMGVPSTELYKLTYSSLVVCECVGGGEPEGGGAVTSSDILQLFSRCHCCCSVMSSFLTQRYCFYLI